MGKYPLYNSSGAFLKLVEFAESVFGDPVNETLLHASIVMYEANLRQGTTGTKERGDVAGSTRKPWQQKHTGRARAGSRKSPLWRGGGTIFGPRPRDYRLKMTRKARISATKCALLSKFLDKEVLLIEKLAFERPKTSEAAGILEKIGVRGRLLIGIAARDESVLKSVRNLQGVELRTAADLNARDLLKRSKVLFTLGALDELKKRFGAEQGGSGK